MKLKFLYISFVLAALSLVACQNADDVIFDDSVNLDDSYIAFAASQDSEGDESQTRTVYNGKDGSGNFVINWSLNDRVTLYCPQVSNQHTYKIKTYGSKSSDLEATSTDALKWGTGRSKHDFYAVYPGGNNNANFENDGSVVELSLLPNYDNCSNNVSFPSMEYAYMVAKTTSSPTNSKVSLDFKPIMSTYDVTLTNSSSESIKVYGFTVKMNNEGRYIKNGKFKYNLDNESLEPYSEATNKTEYFRIGFNSGENYITMAGKSSVTFTLFLPPIPDAFEVMVNANFEYSKTFKLTNNNPKQRTAINVKLEQGGSGWIGLLDDDIYASQLSLPGASWTGCNTTLSSTGKFSGYAIQGWNVQKLWENGVRVFDFHGDNDTKAFQVQSYDLTVNALFNTLSNLLDQPKYEKEFAIIIIRQDKNKTSGSKWQDFCNTYWASGKCVNFKADATIKDLRKKILVLALDWGSVTMPKFSGNFVTNQWPTQYASSYVSSGWYTSKDIKNCTIVSNSGAQSNVIVSDFVKISDDIAAKLKLVSDHLQKVKVMDERTWSIMQYASCTNSTWNSNNFASATGGVTVDARIWVGGSQETGQSLLRKIYGGPSGIILFPFIGLRYTTSGTGDYHPNCDKLVPYQIQRNFVNDLKRKP